MRIEDPNGYKDLSEYYGVELDVKVKPKKIVTPGKTKVKKTTKKKS